MALAFLTLLLTLTTFVYTTPRAFFLFVLINSVLQACAFSYLQPSVVALSSLFGPRAIQAVISGQGAIGVAVGTVQMLGAMASVWSSSPKLNTGPKHDGMSPIICHLITLFLTDWFIFRCSGAEVCFCILGPIDRLSGFCCRILRMGDHHASL